ncbi:MAG: hypothetical protein ABI670_18730 [Chloroflexota bacterium]
MFLVRVRTGKDRIGIGKVEWRGKVQRVVDGESHQFTSLQELMDLLQTMILNSEGR